MASHVLPESPSLVENEVAVDLRHLFPRQSGCAQCQDTTPACPSCPSGQSCQVTVPLTCTECPRSYCATNSPTPTPASKSSPSTGAIAGGVIGGVAVIAIVTYFVWRFFIKTKRQPLSSGGDDVPTETEANAAEMSFNARRDQRSSTHTVHSIASTVLTRASNIIQIAYIPGVMNRATPTSPTILVPPVPPIPIAVTGASQPSTPAGPDDHFFVPGDLRDSTYSGFSGFSDRTSFARTSYAPRSSIASTIYGKNAVIVAPPQTGKRAKPTMVDLKSPVGHVPPPVPNVDYEKYSGLRPVSAANSTFSIGSTFLNNASAQAAKPVRPVVVRVGSGPSRKANSSDSSPVVSPSPTGSAASTIETKTPSSPPLNEKSPLSPSRLGRESAAVTLIEDSPSPDQGPFSDPPPSAGQRNATSLNAVIEEATRRASQRDTSGTSTGRERSPFGDEHATHDD